jgi:hypothetical protein
MSSPSLALLAPLLTTQLDIALKDVVDRSSSRPFGQRHKRPGAKRRPNSPLNKRLGATPAQETIPTAS